MARATVRMTLGVTMRDRQRTYAGIEIYEQWRDREGKRFPNNETRSIDQKAIEDLIAADTPAKIREFTAQWFPFTDYYVHWKHPEFEEEVKAVSDTRDLVMLVLELKRMADEEVDSREAFESLGIHFAPDKDEGFEIAEMFYLGSSHRLLDIVRAECDFDKAELALVQSMQEAGITKEELDEMGYLEDDGHFFDPFVCSYASGRMVQKYEAYLNSQKERAGEVTQDGRYPVYYFFGGHLGEQFSAKKNRALYFIDSIFWIFLQGVRMRTFNGVLRPSADSNLTSLWVRLSESFSDSRITACKTCGLPIIVSGERGTKRLYCNDTCKRKYKRALKFASLVNDDGMELQDAAKASGMAAATATRILERNGIYVNSAQ